MNPYTWFQARFGDPWAAARVLPWGAILTRFLPF